ncbi:MAG: hypothetical protein H0U65_03140 [Rubrobacter sp.]|jgi:hypothetical protein|nr:hypothetical protein [Rubrobacter sp.]
MPEYDAIEVKVGELHEDARGDTEAVSFTGREIASWEGLADSIDPNDQFGSTLRLYECPLGSGDVGYRVYEYISPLTGGGPPEGTLYPPVLDVGYGLYSWEEVARRHPQLVGGEDA